MARPARRAAARSTARICACLLAMGLGACGASLGSIEATTPTPRLRPVQDAALFSGDTVVSAALLCDVAALQPGQSATLGVRLSMTPGWHTYGHAANDTGFEPQLKLSLPEGITVGDIAWPTPERHLAPGDLLDHVYHGDVTLLLPLQVAPDVEPGEVTLSVQLEWLVCDDICLMGSGSASLSLPVRAAPAAGPPAAATRDSATRGTASPDPALPDATASSAPTPGPGAAAIAASRARLAMPAPAQLELQLDATRARIHLPGAQRLTFIPDPDCLPLAELIEDGVADGETLVLRRAARGPGGARLLGTLVVGPSGHGPLRAHRIAYPPAPTGD